MISQAGVLNMPPGDWAFAEAADGLAKIMGVEVVAEPLRWNYVFYAPAGLTVHRSFVPQEAIQVASDKRLLARRFVESQVPSPETHLVPPERLEGFLARRRDLTWVLKYPTGTGAAGHRILGPETVIPKAWPTPYVVQEFISLPVPEVYRLYGAAGSLFGWNVRRFPPGNARQSPFVAHATGARYTLLDEPPADAVDVAGAALQASGLADSFGCVDLLLGDEGWLALEVGTDGPDSFVDRDVPDPLRARIGKEIARGFWSWVERNP